MYTNNVCRIDAECISTQIKCVQNRCTECIYTQIMCAGYLYTNNACKDEADLTKLIVYLILEPKPQ